MPYARNLDFQISGRFGFWLTPSDPGVSAQALNLVSRYQVFGEIMLVSRFQVFCEIWLIAGIEISSSRRDLGHGLRLSGPGVSA